VYQAPNRSEQTLFGASTSVITIGPDIYAKLSNVIGGLPQKTFQQVGEPSKKWAEWVLDGSADGSPDALDGRATQFLTEVLNADSVQRSSNEYTSESLSSLDYVPAPLSGHGPAVTSTSVTSVVSNRRVVSQDVMLKDSEGDTVDYLEFIYSDFNASPPVVTPAPSNVVRSVCPGTFVAPGPDIDCRKAGPTALIFATSSS
jgi:hypothetical protein